MRKGRGAEEGKRKEQETKKQTRTNPRRKIEHPARRRRRFGNIGLSEYNPEMQIWECRIDDCEAKIEKSTGVSHHRRLRRSEQYSGPNRQEMTCPYCRRTMGRRGYTPHSYGSTAAGRKQKH